MPIALKRVYEEPVAEDGYRVLVDRLWPRGVSEDRARLDEWVKEAAPSDQLRKWFHHDRSQWSEFQCVGVRPCAGRACRVYTDFVPGSGSAGSPWS